MRAILSRLTGGTDTEESSDDQDESVNAEDFVVSFEEQHPELTTLTVKYTTQYEEPVEREYVKISWIDGSKPHKQWVDKKDKEGSDHVFSNIKDTTVKYRHGHKPQLVHTTKEVLRVPDRNVKKVAVLDTNEWMVGDEIRLSKRLTLPEADLDELEWQQIPDALQNTVKSKPILTEEQFTEYKEQYPQKQ